MLSLQESELLDYIDAEELPPILVDLLDKAKVCLLLVVEICCYIFSRLV